jgi:hypothetical protein
MADAPNLVVAGDSREAVAYALFLGIARHEKKNIYFQSVPTVEADADWVLSTYHRCLITVMGQKT